MSWANAQVLEIQQSAQILAFCGPTQPIVEDLCNLIAELNACPPKAAIIANDSLSSSDWALFCSYTSDVDPNVSVRPEYIPVCKPKDLTLPKGSLY